MRRARWLPILLLVGLLVAPSSTASAAAGDPGAEARFHDALARERSGRGLSALRTMPDLVDIARRHSAEMAANGRIYHNAELGSEVQGWQKYGENVGRGSSVDYVHKLLMESSSHRANILSREFTELGIGVAWSGSTVYVTQIFRLPAGSATAAGPSEPPPPAPVPTPAPAAAPAPAKTAAAAAPEPIPPTTSAPRPPAPEAPAASATDELLSDDGALVSATGARRGEVLAVGPGAPRSLREATARLAAGLIFALLAAHALRVVRAAGRPVTAAAHAPS